MYSKRDKILVTGARGFLGQEIILTLNKDKKFQNRIIALDLMRLEFQKDIQSYSLEDWQSGLLPLNEVDSIINCAFARSNKGEELAKSLIFTKDFFEDSSRKEVKSIINISTQSVYGLPYKPLWTETTPVTVDSLYAMAKLSTELITEIICKNSNPNISFTNIRLSSLVGRGFDIRIINRFIDNVINGETIRILGGNQIFSFLDVRDAAQGIVSLLNIPPSSWSKVYNLGSKWTYSLLDIAICIKEIAKEFSFNCVEIAIDESDNVFESGIDSTLLYNETNWTPIYDMEKIVRDIFSYKMHAE